MIEQQLRIATKTLIEVTDNPRLEAEILFAYALKKPRSYLFAWPNEDVSTTTINYFNQLIARRIKGEPIAYIVEQREFWSLPLIVNRHTLIPRPETELLIEKALELFSAQQKISVADLGTGSGAIAISLAFERPQWLIHATDISAEALTVAEQNAQAHALKNISFYQGNWCQALPSDGYNLIVSNPPYLTEKEWDHLKLGLEFEPKSALVANDDGLQDLRKLIFEAKNFLAVNGFLMLEHGYNQGSAVHLALKNQGFQGVTTFFDLAGHERVTLARRS